MTPSNVDGDKAVPPNGLNGPNLLYFRDRYLVRYLAALPDLLVRTARANVSKGKFPLQRK